MLIKNILCMTIFVIFSTTSFADQLGLPAFSENDQIIHHTAFSLKYDEDCKQAAWVAYRLVPAQWDHSIKRVDDFRPDPKVKGASASLGDYRRSGYDRGHLAPAASMKYSRIAMSESFYLSNMSPQEPGFNRGIWAKLESLVREWAQTHDELYVVTGPLLAVGARGSIGANQVCVPKFYFKVVLDYKEPGLKAIGFILPNAPSSDHFEKFVFTVDDIETLSGIDFFPALPDQVEEYLEANTDFSLW